MELTLVHPIDVTESGSLRNRRSLSGGVSRTAKFLYLSTFMFLVCVRMPNIILHGRFWAEDGSVGFATAHDLPWYEAISHTHAGYVNLLGNFAGILAYLTPINYAPYSSIAVALVAQTIPAALLCLSSEKWLRNRKILLLAMLIIAVQPASQEIWLSSFNGQWFLSLAAGLILALPEELGALSIFHLFVLLIGVLSSPAVVALCPLFILRALIDRSKARAVQAVVLAAGAGVQLIFCLHISNRSMSMDFPLFGSMLFQKHILVPFLGRVESVDCSNYLHLLAKHGAVDNRAIGVAVLVFGALALALFRQRNQTSRWLFAAGMVLTAIAFFGALGERSGLLLVDAGNRYTYAPQVLFELSLLIIACQRTGWVKTIAGVLVFWLVTIGLHEYFFAAPLFSEGPSWRAEVKQWKSDPTHKLAIWPPGWHIDLCASGR